MSVAGGHAADFDCIVIGAGHNGLVCAAHLARAGRRVLVLEASSTVGGAAITREFATGFRVSAGAHRLHMLSDTLIDELGLREHGLKVVAGNRQSFALAPGAAPMLLNDADDSVHGATAADAAAYPVFKRLMRRFGAALRATLESTPPRLGTDEWRDKMALAKLGWSIRKLGRKDMRELLRIGGMNVYDLLEERFESKTLQGAAALDAVLGANAGPRTPGTVLNLLYRYACESGAPRHCGVQVEGGMGALSDALARAAAAAGAVIRTDSSVMRISVRNDRAQGVVLESGEEISAPVVVSNADPKTTFLRLLGSAHLDTGFVRRVVHLRTRGVTAKLHLALDRDPKFAGLAHQPGMAGLQPRGDVSQGGVTHADLANARFIWAPSLDAVEQAFNHAKYSEFSPEPVMEVTVPTYGDTALAPPGRHVVSAVLQYAPYELKEGWAAGKPRLLKAAIEVLERCAPGLASSVIAAELLTPVDLEHEFRMTGGHWHHAEFAFDQFFMVRPVPGAAQYATPVPGLFLCGAGAHPGGGVNGLAGRNAARRILADSSR